MKNKILDYLTALENSDLPAILSLFSADAIVNSPLYGHQKASVFYEDLFQDTSNSNIQLLEIFGNDTGEQFAALFLYDWTLKNGDNVSFKCVDIFEFDDSQQICKLSIIYDTANTRSTFEKVKHDN